MAHEVDKARMDKPQSLRERVEGHAVWFIIGLCAAIIGGTIAGRGYVEAWIDTRIEQAKLRETISGPATLLRDLEKQLKDQGQKEDFLKLVRTYVPAATHGEIEQAVRNVLAKEALDSPFVKAVATAVKLQPVQDPRIRIIDVNWQCCSGSDIRDIPARTTIMKLCDDQLRCRFEVDQRFPQPQSIYKEIRINFACNDSEKEQVIVGLSEIAFLSCAKDSIAKPAAP